MAGWIATHCSVHVTLPLLELVYQLTFSHATTTQHCHCRHDLEATRTRESKEPRAAYLLALDWRPVLKKLKFKPRITEPLGMQPDRAQTESLENSLKYRRGREARSEGDPNRPTTQRTREAAFHNHEPPRLSHTLSATPSQIQLEDSSITVHNASLCDKNSPATAGRLDHLSHPSRRPSYFAPTSPLLPRPHLASMPASPCSMCSAPKSCATAREERVYALLRCTRRVEGSDDGSGARSRARRAKGEYTREQGENESSAAL